MFLEPGRELCRARNVEVLPAAGVLKPVRAGRRRLGVDVPERAAGVEPEDDPSHRITRSKSNGRPKYGGVVTVSGGFPVLLPLGEHDLGALEQFDALRIADEPEPAAEPLTDRGGASGSKIPSTGADRLIFRPRFR